jgi:hypothetical protein
MQRYTADRSALGSMSAKRLPPHPHARARLPVLDVGYSRRNPLRADAGDFQDHLRRRAARVLVDFFVLKNADDTAGQHDARESRCIVNHHDVEGIAVIGFS